MSVLPFSRSNRSRLPTVPALGNVSPLPRRTRRIRVGILAVLVLAVVIGLGATRFLAHTSGQNAAFAIPGAVQVAPSFYRGPPPSDSDLSILHDVDKVRAVIRVGSPDIAEQATTQGLEQAYLQLPVPSGEAPTLAQLTTAATFLRQHLPGGVVYLHDGTGDGAAIATSAQLELLRGTSLGQVLNQLSAAEVRQLSSDQLIAIRNLAAALSGTRPSAPNEYASAHRIAW